MDANSLIALQNAIVVEVSKGIEEDWDAAMVNIEIDVLDGDQCEDCLALSFVLQKGAWKWSSFRLPFDCYDLFRELCQATDQWKSCTLEFNSSGKYRFSYSFEPPPRLNGIWDDESMFKNYSPPALD